MSLPLASRNDCQIRAVEGATNGSGCSRALPAPAIVQAWGCTAKLAAGGWRVERLVFEQAASRGDPPGAGEASAGGCRVAARINRGPQFLRPAPGGGGARRAAALRKRWRFGRRGLLVLAPGLTESDEHRQWLREAGFIALRYGGLVFGGAGSDPGRGHPAQAAWPPRGAPNNGAERGGLEFEISDKPVPSTGCSPVTRKTCATRALPASSPDFLRALRERAPEDVFVCQALHDGQPLAGMIVFRFARSAEYFVGWFGPEAPEEGRQLP